MTIQRIHHVKRAFRCSDGSTFAKQAEASQWENVLKLRAFVREKLGITDSPALESVTLSMIDNNMELRNLLLKSFPTGPLESRNQWTEESTIGNDQVDPHKKARSRKAKNP